MTLFSAGQLAARGLVGSRVLLSALEWDRKRRLMLDVDRLRPAYVFSSHIQSPYYLTDLPQARGAVRSPLQTTVIVAILTKLDSPAMLARVGLTALYDTLVY